MATATATTIPTTASTVPTTRPPRRASIDDYIQAKPIRFCSSLSSKRSRSRYFRLRAIKSGPLTTLAGFIPQAASALQQGTPRQRAAAQDRRLDLGTKLAGTQEIDLRVTARVAVSRTAISAQNRRIGALAAGQSCIRQVQTFGNLAEHGPSRRHSPRSALVRSRRVLPPICTPFPSREACKRRGDSGRLRDYADVMNKIPEVALAKTLTRAE